MEHYDDLHKCSTWNILSILIWGTVAHRRPTHDQRPTDQVIENPKVTSAGESWNPARMPINYRIDPGAMAVNASGTVVVDHTAGAQRVQSMFAVWQGVSTANLSYSNVGPLLSAGSYSGGDLKTAQQFNDVMGSCKSGVQNPVIFDADGKLIASLGLPPEVIGFNAGCVLDTTNGYLLSSAIVMNGQFQDGINSPASTRPNFELTANEFDEAITHEIGHFSGLDHSQINLIVLLQNTFPCDVDELAGCL